MDSVSDQTQKYCIIGAGPSGLAAAKNLSQAGIAFDIIERHAGLGGIWDIKNPYSTVYDGTCTITSRKITAYTDFPFPEDTPLYIHHPRVLDYLKSYAERFGLMPHIQFGLEVMQVEKKDDGWRVSLSNGEVRHYGGLIIANGHNWSPKMPQYPGTFTGEILHSSRYKNSRFLEGKRVLVVGAGNTGCDIAVEAMHHAKVTDISMRRGYYFVPKFVFGQAADELGQNSQSISISLKIVRFFYKLLLRLTMGMPQRYGLPAPDHELLESPPIVNNLLPYYVAHHRIGVQKDIERFEGNTVFFKDGTSRDYDTVIFATGYEIVFPFMDVKYLNWKEGKPDLYLMAFHPEYDNLFVAGLTDGTGGHFPTVDLQTQVIARYIAAKREGARFAAKIDKNKRNGNWDFSRGIRFIDSSRSLTQFEIATFRKHMLSLVSEH